MAVAQKRKLEAVAFYTPSGSSLLQYHMVVIQLP
jgi:hypothetical protein